MYRQTQYELLIPCLYRGVPPVDADFDLVVYCTDPAFDPPIEGQARDTFGFEDLRDMDALRAKVALWSHLVRTGRRVVAVCATGVNRSGIACILTMLHLGYSLDEAIQIVARSWRGAPAGDVRSLLASYSP